VTLSENALKRGRVQRGLPPKSPSVQNAEKKKQATPTAGGRGSGLASIGRPRCKRLQALGRALEDISQRRNTDLGEEWYFPDNRKGGPLPSKPLRTET